MGRRPRARASRSRLDGALPGVVVTTNEQGQYRFARIFPEGSYTLDGARSVTGGLAQETICPARRTGRAHDVRLKGTGTVRVRVVDGANQPVANAFVR